MTGVAQETMEIGDRVACPTCSIETGPPLTLTANTDRFSLTSFPPLIVARDGEGNHIVGPVTGDAMIAVFGPDGSYRSSHGKIGMGPGEFAAPYLVSIEVGEGDALYVMDPMQLHTLAPRAETGLGQVRMRVQPSDAVALRDGIAVQATVRAGAGNTTVQLLRPDGTIKAGIGASGTGAERSYFNATRVLGKSNNGVDVRIAHINRYLMSRYSAEGEEKTRIERISEWFRPYSESSPGSPFFAPADPGIEGIYQDADGLLWVAIVRAPPSFSPFEGGGGGGELRLNPHLDMNRFQHTTIEVLDPATGELLARREFDEYVRFVRTPGDGPFIYSLRPDALGDLMCIVTPLKLRRG